MAPRGSPRHRPARPPTGRIHDGATVTATLRASNVLVARRRPRHERATNAFLYISTPLPRARIAEWEWHRVAPQDFGRNGHPQGVFMSRPRPSQRYGWVVRLYISGGRATCAPRTHLYIYSTPPRRALESQPSAKMLIRDIGRHGSPWGVFMTRPPSPQRYGRVLRWYTSGGRATCAPRTHFFIFGPRRRELESIAEWRREAPRDIGRRGHPRGASFMMRLSSPWRYGSVVRWYPNGGHCTCAPHMHNYIFRPAADVVWQQSCGISCQCG
jgi:hypothetical protein